MHDDLFAEIRRTCRGQLRPEVYREIYQTALRAPAGDFLEIGTAHGAATVTMALAVKDSNRKSHVWTIGKPGIGDHIGDLKELQSNFERYGVNEIATAVIINASEAPEKLPADLLIGLLMIDADGRIDRDFQNFYSKVVPGAPIIIDDYDNRAQIKLGRGGRAIGIGLKLKLAFALANHFKKAELIENFRVINQTLFCQKSIEPRVLSIDHDTILDIYATALYTWQQIDRKTVRTLLFSIRDIIRGWRK